MKTVSELKEIIDNAMADLIELDINEANSLLGELMDDLTPADIIDYRKGDLDAFLGGLDANEIAGFMYEEVTKLSDEGIENLLLCVKQCSSNPPPELLEMVRADFDNITHQMDTATVMELWDTLENSYHAAYREGV